MEKMSKVYETFCLAMLQEFIAFANEVVFLQPTSLLMRGTFVVAQKCNAKRRRTNADKRFLPKDVDNGRCGIHAYVSDGRKPTTDASGPFRGPVRSHFEVSPRRISLCSSSNAQHLSVSKQQ